MSIISQISYNGDKAYLEVDGKPFLYNSVQSWYPPEGDYAEYIKKTAELNYKCFTFWLYWRHLEPVEGQYEWYEIDRVIDLADKYDVYLDIIWSGTLFCDHMDKRFTPPWVMENDDYHLKDKNGNVVLVDGRDMGMCPALDTHNREILTKENRILARLIEHLAEYDKNHRVILIEVSNEINLEGYQGGKAGVLHYVNELARQIKSMDHKIATRTNILSAEMDKEIDELEYIDGLGLDTYRQDISVTRKGMLDSNNTKLKYIAENAAYDNSTSHIVAALANGGFYNIYKLDYDVYHKKPGIYNAGWEEIEVTGKIRNLNGGLNRLAYAITISKHEDMIEFNTDETTPLKNYVDTRQLNGRKISFITGNKGAVGIGVLYEGGIFITADEDAQISLETEGYCEYGRMDAEGKWHMDELIPYKPNELIQVFKGVPIKI